MRSKHTGSNAGRIRGAPTSSEDHSLIAGSTSTIYEHGAEGSRTSFPSTFPLPYHRLSTNEGIFGVGWSHDTNAGTHHYESQPSTSPFATTSNIALEGTSASGSRVPAECVSMPGTGSGTLSGSQMNPVAPSPALPTPSTYLGRMTLTAPDNMLRRKEREKKGKQARSKHKNKKRMDATAGNYQRATGFSNEREGTASTMAGKRSNNLSTFQSSRNKTLSRVNMNTAEVFGESSGASGNSGDTTSRRGLGGNNARTHRPVSASSNRSASSSNSRIASPAEVEPRNDLALYNIPSRQRSDTPVSNIADSTSSLAPPVEATNRPPLRSNRSEGATPSSTSEPLQRQIMHTNYAADLDTGPLGSISRNQTLRRYDVYSEAADLDLPGAEFLLDDADDAPPPFPVDAMYPSSSPHTSIDPVSEVGRTQEHEQVSISNVRSVPIPSSPPPPFQSGEEDESSSGSISNSNDEDEHMRPDRSAWEADLAAGLSLQERVAREERRQQARLENMDHPDHETTTNEDSHAIDNLFHASSPQDRAENSIRNKQDEQRNIEDARAEASERLEGNNSSPTAPNAAHATGTFNLFSEPTVLSCSPSSFGNSTKVDRMGRVQPTRIRRRPASDSHTRFRDDAAAAAARRRKVWKKHNACANLVVPSSPGPSFSRPYSTEGIVSKEEEEERPSIFANGSHIEHEQPRIGVHLTRSFRQPENSGEELSNGSDAETSSSESVWQEEEEAIYRLHHAKTSRRIPKLDRTDSVIDNSTRGNVDRWYLPSQEGTGHFLENIESLPEGFVPRAPPPLALGRSRGGGSSYSSASSSSLSISTSSDDKIEGRQSKTEASSSWSTSSIGCFSNNPSSCASSLAVSNTEDSTDNAANCNDPHTAASLSSASAEIKKGKQRDRREEERPEPSTQSGSAQSDPIFRESLSNSVPTDYFHQNDNEEHILNKRLVNAKHVDPYSSHNIKGKAPMRSSNGHFTVKNRLQASGEHIQLDQSKVTEAQDVRTLSDVERNTTSEIQPAKEISSSCNKSKNTKDVHQASLAALKDIDRLKKFPKYSTNSDDSLPLHNLEKILLGIADPDVSKASQFTHSKGTATLGTNSLLDSSYPMPAKYKNAEFSTPSRASSFSNPRSVFAPLPTQVRLPKITNETRHFPRSQQSSCSISNSTSMASYSGSSLSSANHSTTNWHSNIPVTEQSILPAPLQPDYPKEQVQSSAASSRVSAMVSRFESGMSDTTQTRQSLPLSRAYSSSVVQKDSSEPSSISGPSHEVNLRRRPPPPPPVPRKMNRFAKVPHGVIESSSTVFPTTSTHGVSESRKYGFSPNDTNVSPPMVSDLTDHHFHHSNHRPPPLPPRLRNNELQTNHSSADYGQSSDAVESEGINSRFETTSVNTDDLSNLLQIVRPSLMGREVERQRQLPNPADGTMPHDFGRTMHMPRPLPRPPHLEDISTNQQTVKAESRNDSAENLIFGNTTDESENEGRNIGQNNYPQYLNNYLPTDTSTGSSSRNVMTSSDAPPSSSLRQFSPQLSQTPHLEGNVLQTSHSEGDVPQTTPHVNPSLEVTDLDLLASQLEQEGDHYEEMTTLADFLGPGRETRLKTEEMELLPVGRVEVERRRITREGKVKQKLGVVGVRVDRCTVCMMQFREDQMACVLPCLHVLHEQCALKLFHSQRTCPTCRRSIT